MDSRTTTSTRFAGRARLDVTDCEADRLPERARANDVRGAELHLERRGGRTYLVADESEQ